MIKGFEDFQRLSRGNMDLMVKGMGEVSKAFQVLVAEAMDYSRRNLENGTASAEKILTAGTADRAFEAQIECLRAAYEDYISQVNRVFELGLGAAKGALQPASGLPSTSSSSGKASSKS